MAKKKHDIPWQEVYDYVLACGQVHDPYRFVVTALDEIGDIIPYDQGLAWCLDENRNVCEQHLVNIKARWTNMYIEYYAHLQDDRQGLYAPANEAFGLALVRQVIWANEEETEFVRNYLMARGVKCSLSSVLFDQNGRPCVVITLDRTRSERFSSDKIEIMRLVAAQLGNLYKNFFTDPSSVPGRKRKESDVALAALLTTREREVVDLLCQGLSPSHVADTLFISTSTAYKHIANIYKKLHVSSQQELLVRVLKSR
ncbi:MAG: helix-turn-helix transcriptional regulator [Eggerthellaceae bacterium]|nr:helix-turn-helix transcriptional regulator [Eggerthellaceae bacterium]